MGNCRMNVQHMSQSLSEIQCLASRDIAGSTAEAASAAGDSIAAVFLHDAGRLLRLNKFDKACNMGTGVTVIRALIEVCVWPHP